MKLSQKELLQILKNMHVIQSNEYARMFILKKAESLLRDFLTIELEMVFGKYPEKLITAVHEYMKHDVVILTGGLNKRKNILYTPTTIIELKFTKTAWITVKENDPVGKEEAVQDNIWRENMMFKKENLGKESGIKRDLLKMIRSQSGSGNSLAFHHVLILSNPHTVIDKKYRQIIDGINLFNSQLSIYGNNHLNLFQSALNILRKQLGEVQSTFLEGRTFEIGYETITVGEAFGTFVDLHFIVISE